MIRKERSRNRSINGCRIHKRKNIDIKYFKKGRKISNDKSSDISLNISEEKETKKDIKLKRKQYTILEKLKAINMVKGAENYEKKTISEVSNIMNVPKSSIYDWIQQEKYLLEKTNKNYSYRLEGAGRMPDTLDIENELLKWIGEQLRLNKAITSTEIIMKAQELKPELIGKNHNTIYSWYCSFLKRYGYYIKCTTHIAKKLKENTRITYKDFLTFVYKMRDEIGDLDDYDNIINMDEIPIYMDNISDKTLEPKGVGLKSRISIIRKLDIVINKEIYVCCQKGGWADKNVFEYWYKNILFNYMPNNDINKSKILILDRATTHYDTNLVNIFKENNCKYILIPPGITRFTQPLDVSINMTFKVAIKKWDSLFRIINSYYKKPEYKDILIGINDLWKNENIIKKEIIRNSFKITGISIKLDGSENHLVNINENLIQEFPIPLELLDHSPMENKFNEYES